MQKSVRHKRSMEPFLPRQPTPTDFVYRSPSEQSSDDPYVTRTGYNLSYKLLLNDTADHNITENNDENKIGGEIHSLSLKAGTYGWSCKFTRNETSVTSSSAQEVNDISDFKVTTLSALNRNIDSAIMQYQSDIHTISKTAPPSYAEVMGQSAQNRDNSYAPMSGQPTTYDQSCSQMSGYPSPAPAYQHPSNFYSSIPAQSPYNPSYVPIVQSQQSYPAVAPCIVRTDALGPREERTFGERCATCNKKFAIALVFTVLILYLIKVIVSRSM